MENTSPQPSKPAFSQYAAFPDYDRTKEEIVDAYLKHIEDWGECVKTPNDSTRFKRAIFSLIKWYLLVHGFTRVKPAKDLEIVKTRLDQLPALVMGGKNIDSMFTLNDLNKLQFAASNYMVDLGITSILQRHREDRLYIADGM